MLAAFIKFWLIKIIANDNFRQFKDFLCDLQTFEQEIKSFSIILIDYLYVIIILTVFSINFNDKSTCNGIDRYSLQQLPMHLRSHQFAGDLMIDFYVHARINVT